MQPFGWILLTAFWTGIITALCYCLIRVLKTHTKTCDDD